MPIEWEKIKQKPNKSYKIEGQDLLDLRQNMETKKHSLTELSNNNIELAAKQNSLEAEIANLKSSIKEKDDKNISLQSTINEKDEKIANLETKIQALQSSLTKQEADFWGVKEDLSDKNNEIAELQTQNTRLQTQITQLTNQLSQNETDVKNQLAQNESDINRIRNELTILQSDLKIKEERLHEKDGVIESLQNENTKLNTLIDELKEQIKPVYEQLKAILEWSPSSEVREDEEELERRQAEAEAQRRKEEELQRQREQEELERRQAEAEAQRRREEELQRQREQEELARQQAEDQSRQEEALQRQREQEELARQQAEAEDQRPKEEEKVTDLQAVWKKIGEDTKPNTEQIQEPSVFESGEIEENIASLTLVKGITEETARILINANINTIMGLAISDPEQLSANSGLDSSFTQEIIKNAKDLLGLD